MSQINVSYEKYIDQIKGFQEKYDAFQRMFFSQNTLCLNFCKNGDRWGEIIKYEQKTCNTTKQMNHFKQKNAITNFWMGLEENA